MAHDLSLTAWFFFYKQSYIERQQWTLLLVSFMSTSDLKRWVVAIATMESRVECEVKIDIWKALVSK